MLRRIAITSACLGACFFPSLDGLVAPEEKSIDATSDVHDAHAATDASIDAPPAPPFCATQDATFCADFDDSADAAAGFTSIYANEAGTLVRDLSMFQSPPASLAAGNGALSAPSEYSHDALAWTSNKTPKTSVAFGCDMRIDKLAAQGTSIEALSIVFEASPRSSLQLSLSTTTSEVDEELIDADGGKTYVRHVFDTPLAQETWFHIAIVLDLSTPRTLTVTVDSFVVVVDAIVTPEFAIGDVDLYVGNSYAPGPSDGALIHYDNALLQLE